MKTSIALLIAFCLFAACKQGNKSDLKMEGAYSLTLQVLNDGTKDSTLDRGQLKIYTKNFMMYASPNVNDSFANFGTGRWREEDGKIIENGIYRASTGDAGDTAILTIEKTKTGYNQIIEQLMLEGKPYKLTEEYDDVSIKQTSPLDGAWKQVKNVFVPAKGDSSVNSNPLEYKLYHAGHFVWGITATDTAGKKFSVYGYGTFAMDGKDKTKETVRSSTYQSSLVGKTYEVDIKFDGEDNYTQTITFANGDKSIEVYKRLK